MAKSKGISDPARGQGLEAAISKRLDLANNVLLS